MAWCLKNSAKWELYRFTTRVVWLWNVVSSGPSTKWWIWRTEKINVWYVGECVRSGSHRVDGMLCLLSFPFSSTFLLNMNFMWRHANHVLSVFTDRLSLLLPVILFFWTCVLTLLNLLGLLAMKRWIDLQFQTAHPSYCGLLGCDTVQSCRRIPTFRRSRPASISSSCHVAF
jgi:hypothetical protein